MNENRFAVANDEMAASSNGNRSRPKLDQDQLMNENRPGNGGTGIIDEQAIGFRR